MIGVSSFLITLVLEVALFIKLRFQMDKSAIIQLLAFLTGMFLRCVDYVTNSFDKKVIGIFRVSVTLINWALLYFMVFEMIYIRALIESESA